MSTNRYPMLAGVCAVTLITGCATAPGTVGLEGAGAKVAGVYRVQEPAGTAAGQYAVGRMDLAEGRIAAAIRRFENALKLDPNYVEALNGLGVAYGQSGRYAEAVAVFRSALASGPAAPHVLNNLGYAQMKAGQLHEAAVALARSIELDPTSERTRENVRLLAQARESATLARAVAPVLPAAPSAPIAAVAERSTPAPSVAAAAPQVHPAQALPPEAAEAERGKMVGAPAELTIAPFPPPSTTSAGIATADVVQATAAQVELTMAPSLPPQAGPTEAAQTGVAQTDVAQPELTMAPTPPSQPAGEQVAEVEPVRSPEVEVAMGHSAEKTVDWTARLTSATQAIAMTASQAPVANKSYEVVAAQSGDGVLVRLAPNLYELRHVAPAPRVATTSGQDGAPVPLAAVDGLEVSNGVGLPRLASRTARQLSRFGADVARVSDWRSFGQQRTEIHYRAGHVAGAKAVQARLPVEAKLVRAGQMHAGVNVRLVVGRDMVAGTLARWFGSTELARADTKGGWRHL